MQHSPIIDMHCHTAGIGAGGSGCFISGAMRKNWRYSMYLKAFKTSQQRLEQEGDNSILHDLSATLTASRHVDSAVILAMDGIINAQGQLDMTATEMYIPNGFIVSECASHANLHFGASINPLRRDAIERLDKAVENGAVLLKWLPSIQMIDPASKQLIPFYKRLQMHGLPLLTHTGSEGSFTWSRDELADPDRLRLPLSLGVTVIAAHAASHGRSSGEHNFSRFMRLQQQFSNLYADISALTIISRIGHLNRILRQNELHERLVYGSDMPLLSTIAGSPWFHAHRINPVRLLRIHAEKNPWDRDIELKLALGTSDAILRRAASLLRINHNNRTKQ